MADTEAKELPVHPEVRYEHTDIDGRNVIGLAAGVLVGAWIVVALLYYFFAFLMHYRAESGPPAAARAAGRTLVPPEPRIQASPRSDLQALRSSEDSQLGSYGWVDRGHGIVSIPIDEAIKLTAQRGIPALHSPLKVCEKNSATWQQGVGGIADPMMICPPQTGSRETGLEGKVEPEPR